MASKLDTSLVSHQTKKGKKFFVKLFFFTFKMIPTPKKKVHDFASWIKKGVVLLKDKIFSNAVLMSNVIIGK